MRLKAHWRDTTLKSTLKRVGVRSSSPFRVDSTRCHRGRRWRRHAFAHADPNRAACSAKGIPMDGSTRNLASPSSDSGYRYWAFISYSHHDEVWAHSLHKALENYKVPRKLVAPAALHLVCRSSLKAETPKSL